MSKSSSLPRACWRAATSPEIVLFHSRYDWAFMPHTHGDATLLVVTDGAVELGIGSRQHLARKGDLAIIGPHQVHWAKPAAPGGWVMRSAHLPIHVISRAAGISVSDCSQMQFDSPVRSIASIASSFVEVHEATGTMRASPNDMQGFLGELYRTIDDFGPFQSSNDAQDDGLTEARNLLSDCAEETEVGKIASKLGLSVFSFIRRYEKAFGIAPHGWRMQSRANQAARLLRERQSAAATAAFCGFADQSHMVRVFKKVFGITPGQYAMPY